MNAHAKFLRDDVDLDRHPRLISFGEAANELLGLVRELRSHATYDADILPTDRRWRSAGATP